ncbi:MULTISPECIES: spore protein [unclassified Sutcliffiella]
MSKQQKNQQQQRKNQVESAPGQEDKKLKGPNRPST